MHQLFVTGMLRSGTSLLQTLLTNHPQLFVAYQPFHQLYVDVKRMFLQDQGWTRLLPLGDSMDAAPGEAAKFAVWLASRSFDDGEIADLVARATTGKGGGASELVPDAIAGPATFLQLREALHGSLVRACGTTGSRHVGSKEVLCEEFIPFFAEAGIRCFIIVRDPRAVVASANHGRYRELVGDRYPLLMLVRLWRKSALFCLSLSDHPMVTIVRYEDLITRTDRMLCDIAEELEASPFPNDLLASPLLDHRGSPWMGNSSFGDKSSVDASSDVAWKSILSNADVRFIEACAAAGMDALGYAPTEVPRRDAISSFVEDTDGVRPAYLQHYALDAGNRQAELDLWNATASDRSKSL